MAQNSLFPSATLRIERLRQTVIGHYFASLEERDGVVGVGGGHDNAGVTNELHQESRCKFDGTDGNIWWLWCQCQGQELEGKGLWGHCTRLGAMGANSHHGWCPLMIDEWVVSSDKHVESEEKQERQNRALPLAITSALGYPLHMIEMQIMLIGGQKWPQFCILTIR